MKDRQLEKIVIMSGDQVLLDSLWVLGRALAAQTGNFKLCMYLYTDLHV